jgi:L-iditol 2-dehydrogenase
MKAFVVTAPFKFELTDVSMPTIGSDQVLVRVGACGICGSDLDILRGTRPMEVTAYPVILGHEFSGEIVELGSAVEGLEPGDKVAIDTIVRCNSCKHCRMGWTGHCLNSFHQLGCTEAGGMAEFVAVPQRLVYKLPETMDLAEAALAEPLSCAAHGVSKADIKPGDSVVIVGIGPIGAFALQVARLFSPSQLICVEVDEYRLQAARQLGATHTIRGGTQDVAEQILEITNGLGADAIIECTGNVACVQQTFSYVGTKGRIVVIGVPPQRKFEIDFLSMLLKDAVFRPSNGYTTQIWLWVLQLLCSRRIDADKIITHRLPLSEVDRAFSILRDRQEDALKIVTSCGFES